MPPPSAIPDQVRQFIFEHVDSVELLDVLLLLASSKERTWCAHEVSKELRTNPTSVENRLQQLKALELIDELTSSPSCYQYAPKTESNRELVEALAEVYKIRRHSVYELIFSPLKRARKFADAFKFGSAKNED